MKRTRSAFRSGKLVNTPEGEQGFWPSYADMMSSFALILFFLMLIAYLQNMITGNQLVSTQKVLKATQDTLATTVVQVEDAKKELSSLTLDLDNLGFESQPMEAFKYALALPHGMILVTGPTGSGKTTTMGKLAKQWRDQGLSVMMAAGDTFRAAAVEPHG